LISLAEGAVPVCFSCKWVQLSSNTHPFSILSLTRSLSLAGLPECSVFTFPQAPVYNHRKSWQTPDNRTGLKATAWLCQEVAGNTFLI
jgi:hypothetical protein